MKKISLSLILCTILLTACSSQTLVPAQPESPTATPVAAYTATATPHSPAAAITSTAPAPKDGTSVGKDATPTATGIATGTTGIEVTGTLQSTPEAPPTITFTTTSGEKVSMPEFTGDNAVAEALQYVSNNQLWVLGQFSFQTAWEYTSPKASLAGKLFKSIPTASFDHGGPFAAYLPDNSAYGSIDVVGLGKGSVITYQDKNHDVDFVDISNADPDAIYNNLQAGVLKFPPPIQ